MTVIYKWELFRFKFNVHLLIVWSSFFGKESEINIDFVEQFESGADGKKTDNFEQWYASVIFYLIYAENEPYSRGYSVLGMTEVERD